MCLVRTDNHRETQKILIIIKYFYLFIFIKFKYFINLLTYVIYYLFIIPNEYKD